MDLPLDESIRRNKGHRQRPRNIRFGRDRQYSSISKSGAGQPANRLAASNASHVFRERRDRYDELIGTTGDKGPTKDTPVEARWAPA